MPDLLVIERRGLGEPDADVAVVDRELGLADVIQDGHRKDLQVVQRLERDVGLQVRHAHGIGLQAVHAPRAPHEPGETDGIEAQIGADVVYRIAGLHEGLERAEHGVLGVREDVRLPIARRPKGAAVPDLRAAGARLQRDREFDLERHFALQDCTVGAPPLRHQRVPAGRLGKERNDAVPRPVRDRLQIEQALVPREEPQFRGVVAVAPVKLDLPPQRNPPTRSAAQLELHGRYLLRIPHRIRWTTARSCPNSAGFSRLGSQ